MSTIVPRAKPKVTHNVYMHVGRYDACMIKHKHWNKSAYSQVCRTTLRLASRCLHGTPTGTGMAACLLYVCVISMYAAEPDTRGYVCPSACMYIYRVCICTISILVHTHTAAHSTRVPCDVVMPVQITDSDTDSSSADQHTRCTQLRTPNTNTNPGGLCITKLTGMPYTSIASYAQ